jgi:3',5'-cyclic AMP phosphodiesterase CpdA
MNRLQHKNKRAMKLAIVCLFILLICCSVEYPPGDFHAVIISDTHISNDIRKVERLQTLIGWINLGQLPGVELMFVTGDVVSSVYGYYYPENPDTSDNRLSRAVDTFRELHIPFLLVMGNHDYKIGRNRDSDTAFSQQEILDMEQIWEKYTSQAPYYGTDHQGWKFIILNSMRGRYLQRYFDDHQLQWLDEQLAEGKPSLLFFHHPLQTDHFRIWAKKKDVITEDNEPRFYQLLEKYRKVVKGIFVGHGHRWVNDLLKQTIPVFETESFGDASSPEYYVIGFSQQSHTIQVVRNAAIAKIEHLLK